MENLITKKKYLRKKQNKILTPEKNLDYIRFSVSATNISFSFSCYHLCRKKFYENDERKKTENFCAKRKHKFVANKDKKETFT